MSRQVRAVLFGLRHIGVFGWLGVALMFGSLGYAAVIAPEQQAELHSTNGEISRLQRRRLALEHRPLSSGVDSRSTVAAEVASLKAVPDALLTLDVVARNNKLQLIRGAYSYIERIVPGGPVSSAAKPAPAVPRPLPLVEVRIVVPVGGKYRNIRAFVAQALQDRPTLALDGMSLTREAIGQNELQAQLRFTLFARRD